MRLDDRELEVPFDIQPVPGTSLSELNLRQFGEEYLPRAFDPEVLETNERTEVERLAATKMIASADDDTPTILGLLTLGKSPRDYLTNAYVQFLRINGTGLADPIIDEESIDGALAEMLRRCDDKLKAHNRTAVDLTTAVTERRVTTYPLPALQQIVRNAIMHRTYEGTYAPVRITWFNDRIEIQSPGGPFGIVTPGNVDVGPNLGAINRSVLISTDKVVVPLGADLFSLQGLRNLGPTLSRWRRDWGKRLENWPAPSFPLPRGNMEALGYVVQQHGVRLTRPVKAYDKWVNRMPEEYARTLLDRETGPFPKTPALDKNCLATVKHYRSLVPMAQEHRKPIFHLTAADGAIGGHMSAVLDAERDFRRLAKRIAGRAGLRNSDA